MASSSRGAAIGFLSVPSYPMRLCVPLLMLLLVAPSSFAVEPAAGREQLDEAIDRALQFLQRSQERDGAWIGGQRSPAITALCVMAFLSAGHVPGEGRYGETVQKGVEWVLKQQKDNGLIANHGVGGPEMYHHGICTLMLAEVAGMCDEELGKRVRRQLEKAVAVVLKAQRKIPNSPHHGGWRYQVLAQDSDVSVTGWQLMALRAAKNLGCDVPAESIDLAVAYLKRCQDPATGGFRYWPGSRLTVPCTGTAILGLELCGKDQHRSPEVLRAAGYMLKNPPNWNSSHHFFYGIYYCSQAAFQLGDNYWNDYRAKLHKVLFEHQSRDGYWLGTGEGRQFGPSYCTAMAVLSLTPEYRFLPIYQRGEEPTGK